MTIIALCFFRPVFKKMKPLLPWCLFHPRVYLCSQSSFHSIMWYHLLLYMKSDPSIAVTASKLHSSSVVPVTESDSMGMDCLLLEAHIPACGVFLRMGMSGKRNIRSSFVTFLPLPIQDTTVHLLAQIWQFLGVIQYQTPISSIKEQH